MSDLAHLYQYDDRFALTTDPDHPDICYSEIRRYLLIMLDKQPDRLVTWRDLSYRMRNARGTFGQSQIRAALGRLEASGEFLIVDSTRGVVGRPTRKYGRLPDVQESRAG